MQALSRSEMEIMSVLWAEGRPLSRAEIIELSPKKTWKASSIHILLNSMLEKEAIIVDGFTKTGTHYGRTFVPAMSELAFAADAFRQTDAYQKSPEQAVKDIVSLLLNDAKPSAETLQELQALISEKQKKK